MRNDCKYMPFFFSWLDSIADEEPLLRLELLEGMINYWRGKEVVVSKGAKLPFKLLTAEIDRYKQKQEETKERKSRAGKIGMANRWGSVNSVITKDNTTYHNVTEDNKEYHSITIDKDIDKDRDIDKDKNNNSSYQIITDDNTREENLAPDARVVDNSCGVDGCTSPIGVEQPTQKVDNQAGAATAPQSPQMGQISLQAQQVNTTPTPQPKEAKKSKEIDLSFVPAEWVEVIQSWLAYKRSRRESYTSPIGIKAFVSKLQRLADNNVAKAREIIEQSFANNWAGIFALKNDNNENNWKYHYGGSARIKFKEELENPIPNREL